MNPHQLQQLVHIPLGIAYFCLDCSSIHNSNSYCPACSSSSIVPLTKWVAQLVTRYTEKETA